MNFPLFRRKKAQLAPRHDAQEELERILVQGFRALGRLFSSAAELLEKNRLERRGYGQQERFLERVTKER